MLEGEVKAFQNAAKQTSNAKYLDGKFQISNSSAPHLHFHLAQGFDINEPTNSEGLPFIFDSFQVVAGRPDEFLELRNKEMPASEAVVLFE